MKIPPTTIFARISLVASCAVAAVWLVGCVPTVASPATSPAARQDSAAGLEVGAMAPDLALRDLGGAGGMLSDHRGRHHVVLAFNGVECPISKLYARRLQALHERYRDRGVVLYGVNANAQDSVEDLREFVERHGLTFPMIHDAGAVLADRLGAERTTDVFVIDKAGRLRYRGALDDQYTLVEGHASGRDKGKPETNYVIDVIEALLADRPVPHGRNEAPGCAIGRRRDPPADAPITYYRDVEPIIQRRCQDCHRDGEVAPFSLASYEDASAWAGQIEDVVKQGRMPPWNVAPGIGHFANDRSLRPAEKKTLLDWIELDTPPGDPRHRPPPRHFRQGWRIGEPDVVFEMEEPFAVPAEGRIDYHHVVFDPKFERDMWVQGVEIRPGARDVVHHIMAFIVDPARAGSKEYYEEFDGGKNGYFALMVPGEEPTLYPPGRAKKIPAGSRILLTIHYTANGTPTTDRSKIGLIFAKEEVTSPIFTESAFNDTFVIKPGEADRAVHAFHPVDKEMAVVSLTPHLHYRGRSFRYNLHYPATVKLKGGLTLDGLSPQITGQLRWNPEARTLLFVGFMTRAVMKLLQERVTLPGDAAVIAALQKKSRSEILLDVPHYDFGWQNTYRFEKPKIVPANAVINCVAVFDNSKSNPWLSDELVEQTVHWGLRSEDEMMLGYFDYYYTDGSTEPQRARSK